MGPGRIHTVPRDDADGKRVLLKAALQGTELHLLAVADDEDRIFTANLTSEQLEKFRSRKTREADSKDGFPTLAHRALLTKKSENEGISMGGSIVKDQLQLSLRRMVHGVATALGNITIKEDSDAFVELGDWIVDLCTARDEVEILAAKTSNADLELEKEIDRYKEQLKHLVEQKREHDNELVEKFKLLLNSKKQRIRELQAGDTNVGKDASSAVPRTTPKRNTGKRLRESSESTQSSAIDPNQESQSDQSPLEKALADTSKGNLSQKAESETEDDEL